MSSDNAYIIRRHPDGGWTPLMYFMSDLEDDDETFLPDEFEISWHMPSYSTPEEAWAVAEGRGSEYGARFGSDCWDGIAQRGDLYVMLKHVIKCPWDKAAKCPDPTHKAAEDAVGGRY